MHARRLSILIVLVAIGAAACGSSSKSASNGATTTAPASKGGSNGGGSSSTPTTKKLSGDSGSSFCKAVRGDLSAFNGSNFATSSPSDLKKTYEHLDSALAEAESKAPSEIKGDFHTFRTAFAPLLQLLADANYDYTKISPSDYSKFAGLSAPDIAAASAHITQYVTQVCNVSTTPST